MRSSKVIHVVSCHAEGEVGDAIVGGVAPPPGETLWDQRRWIAEGQTLRNFVLNEPRGGVFRHVNLPSFASRLDLPLEAPGLGEICVKTAFGGDSFVVVDPEVLGVELVAERAREIAELGIRITNAANTQYRFEHPESPDWARHSFSLFAGMLRREGSELRAHGGRRARRDPPRDQRSRLDHRHPSAHARPWRSLARGYRISDTWPMGIGRPA